MAMQEDEGDEFARKSMIYTFVASIFVIVLILGFIYSRYLHKPLAHDVPSEPSQEVKEQYHIEDTDMIYHQ